MSKDRRLGRGLAALLGESVSEGPVNDSSHKVDRALKEDPSEEARETTDRDQSNIANDNILLHVYEIDNNPFQPRRDFTEPEIASLAESLKAHDMLQPIVVRRVGERYQLISGERRLRAAIHAGWDKIPARVREADDRLVAELAIVENLQRQDLNPIEKALSFQRYIHEHDCTQEDLAHRLKIDRSTIANLMRLIELPSAVQDSLRRGKISAGHARALLPLGNESQQVEFSERIQREGLSVRDTERQVQEIIYQEDREPLNVVGKNSQAQTRRSRNHQITSLEQELRTALGTRVDIRKNSRGSGKVVIHFSNAEEFDRLWSLLIDGESNKSEAG